ncbi:uncharacterized protein [Drosophila takahashii]|uniref:uncharacterized protein n=1 Tax=Drosophila takahashii TaxID=29030 RepID=UPI001CF92CA6|nr:uncharacterized protein LOC108058083 [Drosophila takahashii]
MSKNLFSDEMCDYLICCVHANEAIWNHGSPRYKVKHLKVDFWQNLAEDLNSKFFPAVLIQSADCNRKWNNLKSYYIYESKKLLKAKKSGADAETLEALDQWKHKAKMEFLSGLSTPLASVNNFTKRSLDMLDDSTLDMDESLTEAEMSSVSSGYKATSTSFKAGRHHATKKKRACVEDRYTVAQASVESANHIITAAQKKDTGDNGLFYFTEYLRDSLSRLDPDLQLKAKRVFSDTVLELESMQLNRNND